MKRHLMFAFASAVVVVASSSAFASPILESLKQQGVQAKTLTNSELGEIKGAALVSGLSFPSVTMGLMTYMVSYKGWGSTYDYTSYNKVGTSYDSSNYQMTYQNVVYKVGGDIWKADFADGPYAWKAANAQTIEYHLQILDNNTLKPTASSLYATAWNRPINTFSW